MTTPYALSLLTAPNPSDTDLIRSQLDAFNRLHAPPDDHNPFAILIRDAENQLVGGLLGATYWGWLVIEILWVAEALRGLGYGSRLLAAAEEEAVKRGCKYAHLDTMSFQAPDFYRKHNYEVFGELQDLPSGNSRIFLKKRLSQNTT